jgi:tetratricopeptide (TPR) repeat protein
MSRLAVMAALVFCASGQTLESPEELFKAAITLQQAGKLEEAITDYRVLLSKYPDVAQVRWNLGVALAGQGKYDDAIVEYKHVLATHPGSQIELNVELNLALAYYKEGQYGAAIENLDKVHAAAPGNTQAILLLSDCYLRAGKNKQVISLLAPLQERADADSSAVNYMLGTALVRDGQAAQGQVAIDRILKNGDSAEARLLIGATKYFTNDFTGALSDLKTAVDLNPKLPDVYAYYGLALLSSGDEDGARQAFEKELSRDPINFDANLRMGVVLREDEDYEGAMSYLMRALRVRPGDLKVRYQIAEVKLAQGKVEDARREFESILKGAPNFVAAHVSLTTIYYLQKRKADGDRERALVTQLNAAAQQARGQTAMVQGPPAAVQ